MYRKKCPSCKKYSYSSSIENLQECAYCDYKQNITDVKVKPADAPKEMVKNNEDMD